MLSGQQFLKKKGHKTLFKSNKGQLGNLLEALGGQKNEALELQAILSW